MDLDRPASKSTFMKKVKKAKSLVFRRSDSERQTEDNGRVRPSTAQHSPKASPMHTDPPLLDAETNIAMVQLSTSPPSCPPPSGPLPSTPQSTTSAVFVYNERRTFPDGSYTSQNFWLDGGNLYCSKQQRRSAKSQMRSRARIDRVEGTMSVGHAGLVL